MPDRRAFLAGLLASGAFPTTTWADAGNPAYLAAAKLPSGDYALHGLNATGASVFALPMPGRGHAAAAHPERPLAVVFARRPGTFALVIDCVTGQTVAHLNTPQGHHFSGHGAFSQDGGWLFTAENDFENARGMIGVWDVARSITRMGAFPSGGVGPHEIRRMPGRDVLVVANGGIDTHPESGRAKLNIPVMRPNLSYLSMDGDLMDQVEPPREWHKNSMRHIALRTDGTVAVAMQWQGLVYETPPLLATHQLGDRLSFHAAAPGLERDMQGYAGSVSFSADGREIGVTGPRGGLAAIFNSDGTFKRRINEPDICGVAPGAMVFQGGFLFTSGVGRVLTQTPGAAPLAKHRLQWDNHLVALTEPAF